MIIPDVNILVYAHRSDQREHAFYKQWLEERLSGGERVGLSCLVQVGFVRVVTHPKMAGGPTPLPQALAFIETLRASHDTVDLGIGSPHWPTTARLCQDTRSSGKAVADAQHAAIAIEHGGTWATRDADFLRFQPLGLKLKMILAP